MKIKMLKAAMVGPHARAKGWVGPADDAEGEALIQGGVAKATNEANTEEPSSLSNKERVAARGKPSAAAAVAKSADELAAILEGTVGDVAEALDGLSIADLDALDKLEAKSDNPRVGVHDAIAKAAAAAAE